MRKPLVRFDPQKGLCAADRAFDLAAMPDDAGVGKQAGDLRLAPGGERFGVEACEGRAKVRALAQDGDPGEAGLKAFKAKKLEQAARVTFGAAPFVVVICNIKRVGTAPGTAVFKCHRRA